MRVIIALLLMLTGLATKAQIGYRAATHDVTITKSYDSSFDFQQIDCNVESTSLVGLDLYWPVGPPNTSVTYNAATEEKYWFEQITAEEETPLESLFSDAQKKMLKDPYYGAGWTVRDYTSQFVEYTYDAKMKAKTKVYKPKITEYTSTRIFSVRTPSAAFENKTFKIVSCSDSIFPGTQGLCYFTFTLKDEENKLFKLRIHSRKIKEYPFYIKQKIERQKRDHAGRKYYVRSDIRGRTGFVNVLDGKAYPYQPGKEYLCTDFSFLYDKKDATRPYYIFKDEVGREYTVAPETDTYPGNAAKITDFLDEAEYTAYKEQQKRTLDSLTVAMKLLEAEAKQAQADQEKKQAVEFSRLKSKYGEKNAELIANGKVRLGMTKAMCLEAWGEPHRKIQSNEHGVNIELWEYTRTEWLKFSGGKLVVMSE